MSLSTERSARYSTAAQVWSAVRGLGFHVQMAFAAAVFIVVSLVGCSVWSITIPSPGSIVIAVIVTIAAVQAIPAIWQSKGKVKLRDASLTIPWAFLLWAILPFPVDIAARVGQHIPLQDSRFVRLDMALGVHIPAMMRWASDHSVGRLIDSTYPLLAPFMAIAFLFPSLTGRVRPAQQFLMGNVIAFLVGLPLFALFPAVGPWSGYHLAVSPLQMQCQSDLLELRIAAPYVHHANGVICFPSFHVMWAILCARALWSFRLLRVPACLLSAMIVLSTMTTGWHYFSDVVGGVLLAVIAIVGSEWLYRLGKQRKTASRENECTAAVAALD